MKNSKMRPEWYEQENLTAMLSYKSQWLHKNANQLHVSLQINNSITHPIKAIAALETKRKDGKHIRMTRRVNIKTKKPKSVAMHIQKK